MITDLSRTLSRTLMAALVLVTLGYAAARYLKKSRTLVAD